MKTTLPIDHVGIVVPDLEDAVAFYVETFGMRVTAREADTDVNDVAIGLPGECVRLRGALLTAGATQLEIHQYLSPSGGSGQRRVCDRGIGHIAFTVTDIDKSVSELSERGIVFNSGPSEITSGTLAGRKWVYGVDPFGIVIELCQHPRAAS